MKLTYNGVSLSALGPKVFQFGGERHEHDAPAEGSAQRRKVTLPWAFHFAAPNAFDALRTAARGVLTALGTSPGRLLWTNDDASVTYLDKVVTVAATGLPEDPNAFYGTETTLIEGGFYYWENLTPDVVTSTVNGGAGAYTLGNVLDFRLNGKTTRASEWRNNRIRETGVMSMRGKLAAPTELDLAARRAWLEAAHAALVTALSAPATTVVHGGWFNQSVRVAARDVSIAQAEWAVEWSFDGEYTKFPNESDYQVAEFRIRTDEDTVGGTLTQALSGRILSQTEGNARAMLAALRTSYAGAAWSRQTGEDEVMRFFGDGSDAFLELSFNDTYRKLSGTLVSEQMTAEDAEELSAGTIRRTYSGHVECTASTWDAAYQAAATRARTRAGNLHPFRKGGRIQVADNQQTENRVVSGAFIVRVEFSFDYEVRGARLFLELRSERSTQAFGPNSLRTSGFIVAPTESAARAEYATIAAAYTTTFRREEAVTASNQWVNDNAASIGATRTPAPPRTWGDVVNVGEVSGGGLAQQFTRLEFSFTQLVEKTTGGELAVRYELRTQADLRTRALRTEVAGEVAGQNRGDTEWAITTLMGVVSPTGQRTGYTRGESREKWYGTRADAGDDRPATPTGEAGGGYLVGVSFTEVYEGVLAPQDGLLEVELAETVRLSAPRIVVQAAAFDRDTPQACGIASGARTIRGFCTGCSEGVVRSFALAQKGMGLPGIGSAPRYWLPDELTTTWKIAPMTTPGVRAGGDANVTVYRAEFTFQEVLPVYDAFA